ncbi:MAG: IS607 family transposase [Magnetospirillum sp.]|nr:IS607 family transposase [Magnetospirillum sp.]
MGKLVSIAEAAKALGVSPQTLRRWEREGKAVPTEKTVGGRRRYDLAKLRPDLFRAESVADRKTIAYARVSSHDQKEDLERQKKVLEMFCAAAGWTYEIVTDLGSGMNDRKKGLKRLIDGILDESVGRLVLTHKDRLLRFGAELVFAVCEAKNVEVIILNRGGSSRGEDAAFEEELASDVLEIADIFSSRLYGSRSQKAQAIVDGLRRASEGR